MALKNCALVIIDVQNEFMSSKGNFPIGDACRQDLIKNLNITIPLFRAGSAHVIWVKAHYENRTKEPLEMAQNVKGTDAWLLAATHVFPTPCCEANTFGAEIDPEVLDLALPQDAVVIKQWYSAFKESTALLDVLRAKKVTDVYFCGLASGTCVLATILDAVKFDDFKVHAIQDCMGWRRFNTHEDAIERMKMLPVRLTNSDDPCLFSPAS